MRLLDGTGSSQLKKIGEIHVTYVRNLPFNRLGGADDYAISTSRNFKFHLHSSIKEIMQTHGWIIVISIIYKLLAYCIKIQESRQKASGRCSIVS